MSYYELEKPVKEFFLDFVCVFDDIEDMDKNTFVQIWRFFSELQTLIDSSLKEVVRQEFVYEYATTPSHYIHHLKKIVFDNINEYVM